MTDIKGMFRANKNNALSANIQYAVCPLKDRLLFVKVGGEFADGGKAAAGTALGGLIGGAIGAAMDRKDAKKLAQKDLTMQRLRELSVSEILKLDKHNFEIPYVSLVSIALDQSSLNFLYMKARTGVLKIETLGKKRLTFDISPKDTLEECRKILKEVLPDKLVP